MGNKTRNNTRHNTNHNKTNHSGRSSALQSVKTLDVLNLALPRAQLLAKCLVRMNEEVSNPLTQQETMILACLIDDALREAMEAWSEMNGASAGITKAPLP
jgi:ribosomal protein L11 methylase PrmA